MNLKEKLKTLRQAHGRTQQQVADVLKIHKSLYCNYEKGVRTPDLNKLKILADYYEVSLSSLILFPLENTVVYSDGVLDDLETVMKSCLQFNETHNPPIEKDLDEIHRHYEMLKTALNKVLDERNSAMDFPDLKFDLSKHTGETVKTVHLDMRGEQLIKEAFEIQSSFLDELTGSH